MNMSIQDVPLSKIYKDYFIPLFSSKQCREIDAKAIAAGIPSLELMENAGTQAAQIIFHDYLFNSSSKKISIFAGYGNNAGDAFVVARKLLEWGCDVALYLLQEEKKYEGDAQINLRRYVSESFLLSQVRHLDFYSQAILQSQIWVDGIFGTGLKRDLNAFTLHLVKWLNKDHPSIKKISLDLPSGLDPELGCGRPICFRADQTLSFYAAKRSLFYGSHSSDAGSVELLPIGIEEKIPFNKKNNVQVLNSRKFLKEDFFLKRESHKYSRGTLLTIGGSDNKLGAILMASHAALKSGAALVTTCLSEKVENKVYPKHSELMFEWRKKFISEEEQEQFIERILYKKKAVICGPGMGTDLEQLLFLKILLKKCKVPLLLDADAITLLPQLSHQDCSFISPTLLTPHQKELERLAESKNALNIEESEKFAMQYCKKKKVWILLKGYRSKIFSPHGEMYINPCSSPVLATAGSGDILSGMIGAFLAQQKSVLMSAATALVWHGHIGYVYEKQHGVLGLSAQTLVESLSSPQFAHFL